MKFFSVVVPVLDVVGQLSFGVSMQVFQLLLTHVCVPGHDCVVIQLWFCCSVVQFPHEWFRFGWNSFVPQLFSSVHVLFCFPSKQVVQFSQVQYSSQGVMHSVVWCSALQQYPELYMSVPQ